jgi:hypothetical protein
MGKGMGKGTERVKQRYRSSCSFSGLHTKVNCPCRKAKYFAEAAALTVASLAYLRGDPRLRRSLTSSTTCEQFPEGFSNFTVDNTRFGQYQR